MLMNVVEWLVTYFAERGMIPEEDREVYAYSLEVALSSAVFWLMMIVLTVVFGQIGPTIVYLGVFFFLRSAIGGYHASTHLRCSALSAAVYLVFVGCITQLSAEVLWTVLLSGAAGVLIALFAPVDHPNKPFSAAERVHYRRQSCRRAAVFLVLQVVLLGNGWTTLAFSAAFGAIQAAGFMSVAYLLQKEGEMYGSSVS